MWYVMQTVSGTEAELKEQLLARIDRKICKDCIIPLYEDVWRRGGVGHINMRRLFPGYVFIDTDDPGEIYKQQKKIQRFTRLLSMPGEDGEKLFYPVEEDEEAFLKSLLEDGVMHVSYIRMNKGGRIETIKGPLAEHAANIVKLDIPHRRAIVEKELFGKMRRIKFGLWTDVDPKLPRLEALRGRSMDEINKEVADIGIYPGDRIKDESGVYGDMVLTVLSVDAPRRMVSTEVELFGTKVKIELKADLVSKV